MGCNSFYIRVFLYKKRVGERPVLLKPINCERVIRSHSFSFVYVHRVHRGWMLPALIEQAPLKYRKNRLSIIITPVGLSDILKFQRLPTSIFGRTWDLYRVLENVVRALMKDLASRKLKLGFPSRKKMNKNKLLISQYFNYLSIGSYINMYLLLLFNLIRFKTWSVN